MRLNMERSIVAREVGTEGKLGVQAQVDDVSGTWRTIITDVNTMAANLTSQVGKLCKSISKIL